MQTVRKIVLTAAIVAAVINAGIGQIFPDSKLAVDIECFSGLVDTKTCGNCNTAASASRWYAKGVKIFSKGQNKNYYVLDPVVAYARGNKVDLVGGPDKNGNPTGFSFYLQNANDGNMSFDSLNTLIQECQCCSIGGGGSGGGGSGDIVQSFPYTGQVLTLNTDQSSFNASIHAGSVQTFNTVNIAGNSLPPGTVVESVFSAVNTALTNIGISNVTASSFDFTDAAGNTQTINFPSGGSGNTSILTDNPGSNSFDHDDGTGNVTTVNYGTANSVSVGSGAPVTNGTEINDTYIDNSNPAQLISYVWDGSAWQQQNSASSSSLSYYDSGLGFWVYATAGVVTTSPVLGNYDMDVPTGGTIMTFHKNFTNAATELTAGGEVQIVIDHNTAGFNTSFTDALLPTLNLLPSGFSNQQYPPQSTGFTQPHGVSLFNNSVSGGTTVQTLTNVNGMVGSGNTMVVKGKF